MSREDLLGCLTFAPHFTLYIPQRTREGKIMKTAQQWRLKRHWLDRKAGVIFKVVDSHYSFTHPEVFI